MTARGALWILAGWVVLTLLYVGLSVATSRINAPAMVLWLVLTPVLLSSAATIGLVHLWGRPDARRRGGTLLATLVVAGIAVFAFNQTSWAGVVLVALGALGISALLLRVPERLTT